MYLVGMIHVGTCGYGDYRPGKGWKERYRSKIQAYADRFSVLEINKTFYSLPMEKTASRWREEAGDELIISVKAWQAVTHPTGSPTWRKRTEKLSETQMEEFGNLAKNSSVEDAWARTVATAKALRAGQILLQTPAKFGHSEENEKRVRDFLEKAKESGMQPVWEPRGDWNEHQDVLQSIFEETGATHAVDILRRRPLSGGVLAYVRLHGLNEREFNYRYTYGEEELKRLADELRRADENYETVLCLFNNEGMYENAHRLKELLG